MQLVTQKSAKCMSAAPDMCKTPVGNAVVPMPYINMAESAQGQPQQNKLTIKGKEVHNIQTQISMSKQNEQGSLGGIVSNVIKGPCKYMKGSAKVFAGTSPVVRVTDPTSHNGASPNTTGNVLSPSQTSVMAMS